ncbi:MAG: S-layer homology domain-containing protein [Syntrophomonas sp.]|nr:S-layer homology domain-containing protein [Syntrophomonas sp.]
MKKTLTLILALLLTMMLSTGTVLAKSDNGNGWGNNNKASKQVQQKIKKSVQEAFKAYSQEKTSQSPSKFSDVHQHWATRSISDMAAIGLFKGYPDGTFKPNQELTLVEALSLVMRIYEDNDNTNNLEDPDEEEQLARIPAWVRGDAKKAFKKGIIKLDRFHSGVQASRAQTAVMIAKALGLEPVDTSDMPFKDGWMLSKEDAGYILALYEEGVMVGSNGNFNPNKSITRAEMASMLERLLNNSEVQSEVQSVRLPATATVEQGKSITLKAVVKYADGSTDSRVSWSSSNTQLATVKNGRVTAASNRTGTVTITAVSTSGDTNKSDTCIVTIVEKQQVIEGTLSFTGNIGSHDGKVYQEYALEVDDANINLAKTKVKSITLQKDNSDVVQLSPNTDTTLWFDVQRVSGEYTLRVVDNNDKDYEATLDWTAPVAVDATATGDNKVIDGIKYVEYELGNLDLTAFTAMHQIKPDGQVVGLTVSSDDNLWFRTTSQITGEHTFLIKKNGIWYSSEIDI